jgi:hypothetical protein
MRVPCVVTAILLVSCVSPQSDTLDPYDARWMAYHLSSLHEPALDSLKGRADAYRFLYLPSFRPMIAIRVTRGNNGCVLVRKEATRVRMSEDSAPLWPDPHPTTVTHSDSFPLSVTACDDLAALVDSLHLERAREIRGGPDGEGWRFEQLRDGRYLTEEQHSTDSVSVPDFFRAGTAFFAAARFTNGRFQKR